MINIFAIPIYQVAYPENLKKLQKSVLPVLEQVFEQAMVNNNEYMNQGVSSYNMQRHLHSFPELQPLVDFMNQHALVYWRHLSYMGRPGMAEMWTNKYPIGSFISTHNHVPAKLASCFYLSQPKNAGNLIFGHPAQDLIKWQQLNVLDADHRDARPYFASFEYEINPTEGDLIIWPSWLQHRTRANGGPQDKIVISANFL